MEDKQEATKKIKIYMGIPTTGTINDVQPYILRELQEKYGDRVEFVWPPVCVRRIFHDYARNEIVREFLESGADVLWFLDSDIAPAKHCLDLITEHWDKWLVAGCPYPVWMVPGGETEQEILFCVYNIDENNRYQPARIPYTGTAMVDGLATGCIFIKREVFAMLEKPYFAFKFNEETRAPEHGEDISFCRKLNDLGIKFFTDFSMVCKHFKNICLLELNNYAINYANRAVLAYDRDIRPQMEAALRAAYQTGKMSQRNPSNSQLILPEGYR